ncbi:hypothetical protein AGMMS49938_02540 [Fibrobacterales bacterium]|nr:hypothetical protein AGMMS49938_02540 [Fibrobacterales bacterium]
MEKQIIKSIIAEKQQQIAEIELVKRPLNLEPSLNYVFIGLRRAGKSYLMYQHIQELVRSKQATMENILYINFEDERLAPIKAKDLGMLLDCYKEMYNGKPIIFLDEIQTVVGWEKFARRLADSKYKVFVTGSNAQMLSREIYTTLGGRFIAQEVYPFSFREYLSFHSVVLHKNWEYKDSRLQVVKLFGNYFQYGGFAETFDLQDKREWMNSLIQKILLGDVIFRNEIRNENALRVLIKKLSESVMQPSSLARIKNVLDTAGASIARGTLVDYLQFLTDAYLIFGISNFSDKLSQKETFKKRYFYDNGLLNNFLFDPKAKLLENIVAIALKKKYADDLYFYHKNIEVDFFIPKENQAVQVAYSLSDDLTREREIKALLKLSRFHPLTQLEIITYDDEETVVKKNGLVIQIIPIWKWLLR